MSGIRDLAAYAEGLVNRALTSDRSVSEQERLRLLRQAEVCAQVSIARSLRVMLARDAEGHP